MEQHPYHISITAPLTKMEKKRLNAEKDERKRMYRREANERKKQSRGNNYRRR